jgi:hypothetical protein
MANRRDEHGSSTAVTYKTLRSLTATIAVMLKMRCSTHSTLVVVLGAAVSIINASTSGAETAFESFAISSGVKAEIANVHTVGCAQDGQVDFQLPPRLPDTIPVKVPVGTASSLSFYSAHEQLDTGVIAPKGWSCFGVYGSSGSTLYVTPIEIEGPILDRAKRIGRSPAVVSKYVIGDTSGRFTVARMAARLFPQTRSFVESVLSKGLVDTKDFAFEIVSSDTIDRLSDSAITFSTPSGKQGLGTELLESAGDQAISGLVLLDQYAPNGFNLEHLAVRLSAHDGPLASAIIIGKLALWQAVRPSVGSVVSSTQSGIEVVERFYKALSRADGVTASENVVSWKREQGPFSAKAITRFYSKLAEPLQLISTSEIDTKTVLVRYRYASAPTHVCNGEAIVTLLATQGRNLIEGIRTLTKC